MGSIHRFECASSTLALKDLAAKNRRVFWLCLGLGTALHLCLTRITGLEVEQEVAKPLTTKFVKREPRLTKALELKKRPQPRRRQVRREMVSVRAQTHREAAPVAISSDVVGSLASPARPMGRPVLLGSAESEPLALAQAIEGTREPADKIAMSLELLDVEALDTGRYQAMVIEDPNDKRNLKGYLRLAVAYPHSVRQYLEYNDLSGHMVALRNLILKLNEWTDIKASISKEISFDSAELFETPWIYLWLTYSMQPTRGEAENLGKYLLNGGFLFFEGHQWRTLQGEFHLKEFVKSALASQGYQQGVDWEYQLLPNSHPIYHCYYDFTDGPPMSHVGWSKNIHLTGRDDDDIKPRSKGIEIGGRLLAINTNQGYIIGWYTGWYPKLSGDPTQFRWGINTIIFALTQEGSITRRLMDSVQ